MTDTDHGSYLSNMATEVLFIIFSYLPAKPLTKCREVCVRWKDIIDRLSRNDSLWHIYCKMDFPTLYSSAWRKSHDGIVWFHIYRSLSLWPKLRTATVIRDEFAVSNNVLEEVQDFTLLRGSKIGVHTRRKIDYYDRNTLEFTDLEPIKGDFLRYTEHDDIVVVMNYHLHLFVSRKHYTCADQETLATFENVKMFLLNDNLLYFVTITNVIYLCRLDDKGLNATVVTKLDDGIISLGYNNHLNVLSVNRTIYTVNENNLVPVCTLGTNTNMLHKLQEHNLLEQLDWRIYFQWMYVLNHTVPQGPLRDIITIRSYGDIFFVGSNWGVLHIYLNPYCNGELDLFNSIPIKQFNFMERSDCLLSTWAILQVDVAEAEDGHTVFVAMPKKIAIIKFVHNFKSTASVRMLPN